MLTEPWEKLPEEKRIVKVQSAPTIQRKKEGGKAQKGDRTNYLSFGERDRSGPPVPWISGFKLFYGPCDLGKEK